VTIGYRVYIFFFLFTVGINVGDRNSDEYLDNDPKVTRVFPTFLNTVTLKLCIQTFHFPTPNIGYPKTVRGQHPYELKRQLDPVGELFLQTKCLDVLDKIVGTLFIF